MVEDRVTTRVWPVDVCEGLPPSGLCGPDRVGCRYHAQYAGRGGRQEGTRYGSIVYPFRPMCDKKIFVNVKDCEDSA